MKLSIEKNSLNISSGKKYEKLCKCYIMRDDLISSFHTNCVRLYKIQKGTLKTIKEIEWIDFLGARSVDLCSHGITTGFDSQNGNSFIGVFYLEESYL